MQQVEPARTAERRSRMRAERVLILAPTGDDAPLLAGLLRKRHLDVVVVDDLATLARELEAGAGATLITSEALDEIEGRSNLKAVLDRQETWSEMPVILFGGTGESEASDIIDILGARAQVVLLERPLGIASFVTATEAALRSRRRQYQVKRLLDELEQSAVEIARAHDEANRARDDFLASLGHELRSPMTAIRGWIQMLKMGELDPVEAATALSMIESSTKVQAHIIEDLMDVSRIIAGKVMIEPAVIELAPLIAQIVATFRASAALQGIHVTADISPEPMTVFADDSRLQQVGWNLISNAIKFTPKGGSVKVTLTRNGEWAVIRVRDSGEGMDPTLIPHIFERYRQGEEGATTKSHGGLGLGLAIVKHLVTSHGGTIEALSEGKGKGAEFVVSLPLVARPSPD